MHQIYEMYNTTPAISHSRRSEISRSPGRPLPLRCRSFSETAAAIFAAFLIGYAGLAVPVLVVGAALIVWPLVPVLVVFAVVVGSLAMLGGLRMLRAAR